MVQKLFEMISEINIKSIHSQMKQYRIFLNAIHDLVGFIYEYFVYLLLVGMPE